MLMKTKSPIIASGPTTTHQTPGAAASANSHNETQKLISPK